MEITIILLPLGGLVFGVLGTLIFGRNYKKRIPALEASVSSLKERLAASKADVSALNDQLAASRTRIPIKAEIRREFQIGYWTDPKDGQRKQVWIPTVWLEYEDGSSKPLDIEGLYDAQGITRFPFPISFDGED
ncbi:MAG: hypothetical protein OXI11_08065 [Gammaproteobacteria bacterium]|nr:hypothetical protein [Gammaproteobacteria bacterium]